MTRSLTNLPANKLRYSIAQALYLLLVLVFLSCTFLPKYPSYLKIEVVELAESGEQEEEKDTSKEENRKNGAEEFSIPDKYGFLNLGAKYLNRLSKSIEFSSVSPDVLTPPPEFI